MPRNDSRGSLRLTPQQQELVCAHLGLAKTVLHYKKFMSAHYRTADDRADLVQEGRLALATAARHYQPAIHGDFERFAANRIQSAVSLTLYEGFNTIRAPKGAWLKAKKQARAGGQGVYPPRTLPLLHDISDRSKSRANCLPGESHAGPTIGQIVRKRFHSAVNLAARRLSAGRTFRNDRRLMIKRLVSERLLIPEEFARTSLRQISRDLRCSFARVATCEKRLRQIARTILEADPLFNQLRRLAHQSELGFEESAV